MAINLFDKLNKPPPNDVVLKYIRHIHSGGNTPFWESLQLQYQKHNFVCSGPEANLRFVVTLINGVVHGRRGYFCMTREILRELVKNDPNLSPGTGFGNNEFKSIVGLFYSYGLIEQVKPPTRGSSGIYRVLDVSLLNEINLTKEELDFQLQACLNFTSKV